MQKPSPTKPNTKAIISKIKSEVATKKTDTKQLSVMPTEEEAFKPTPAMRLWVATSAQLVTDNITEISKECRQQRTNWYDWIKKPGFLKWYEEERKNLMTIVRTKLDNIGIKKAKTDFRYWEAMQKIAGRNLSNEADSPQTPVTPLQQFNFNSTKYVKER